MGKNQKPRKPYQPQRREEESGGGLLGSFRSGMRSVAGSGPRKPKTFGQKFLDVAIWILIAAVAAGFLYRRFR